MLQALHPQNTLSGKPNNPCDMYFDGEVFAIAGGTLARADKVASYWAFLRDEHFFFLGSFLFFALGADAI